MHHEKKKFFNKILWQQCHVKKVYIIAEKSCITGSVLDKNKM